MEFEDEDRVGVTFSGASGASCEDCLVLGQRFFERLGFQPSDGESWAVLNTPTKTETLFFKRGWYTGVWRSMQGAAFISDAQGSVHRLPATAGDPRAASWKKDDLPATLMGVCGLDDSAQVFAWGLGEGSAPAVFRWDGARWHDMPRPPRRVIAMHGAQPDCVFAVGERGLVTYWNGSRWVEMGGVSSELTLSAVFVVSEDEVYAAGPDGVLLRGSIHGWSRLLEDQGPISAVTRWGGDIWVASLGELGLCKLEDRSLSSQKPNLRALGLDGRTELVLCTLDAVISTADGESFRGRSAQDFGRIIEDVPLRFS